MALLNRPEAECLIPVLARMGQAYPQAIYYQFKISTEDFEAAVIARLSSLSNLLQHDSLEAFIGGLEKLTNPEHVIKDTLEIIKVQNSQGDRHNNTSTEPPPPLFFCAPSQ